MAILFCNKNILISLLITISILFSVMNIIPDVYDKPRSSMMLSIAYIGLLMMVIVIINTHPKKIKLTTIDILLFLSTIFYTLYLLYIDLWTLSVFCLLLIYITLRFTQKINFPIIYFSLIVATLILSVMGYLQYGEIIELVDDKYSITGHYYNSSIYGGMLCFLLSALFPFSFFDCKDRISRYIKYLSIAIMLFSVPALIISNSRASWLALSLAIIYVLYIKYRRKILKTRLTSRVLFIVSVSAILLFSGYYLYQLKPDSAKGRILIWKVSIEMIKDKPLTGFGKEGFLANYMHYQAEYLKNKGTKKEKYLAGNNNLVFNEPIRIMVEYGILGIILYLTFIYLVFVRNKRFDIISLTSKSFLIAVLIWGLFSYPDKIFTVLLYSTIALAFLSNKDSDVISFRINDILLKVIKTITLACSILLFIQVVVQHKAFHQFHKLQINKSSIEKDRLLEQLAELESMMSHEVGFVTYYVSVLFEEQQDSEFIEQLSNWEKMSSVNGLYILKGDYLKQKEQFKQAEQNYWLAHYMVPNRQRARVRLALLYKDMGEYEKALKIANEVLNEDVKVYGFETYRLHQQLQEAFSNN